MTPASKLIAQKQRRAFEAEVARGDEGMRLAVGALLIAAEDQAHLDVDVEHYLARLDELGQRARERVARAHFGMGVEALNRFLFIEEGFHGNEQDYYDPRNSYLNQVLDRRTGLPITLSMVYMEVGHRAGLKVEGLGMPAHFIVRASEPAQPEPTLVDPFNQCTLTIEECRERLDEYYGQPGALMPENVPVYGPRVIFTRMLLNLKGIYMNARHYRLALAAVERVMLLAGPEAVSEHLDRGRLLYKMNRFAEAVEALETYAKLSADSRQPEDFNEELQGARFKLAMRN